MAWDYGRIGTYLGGGAVGVKGIAEKADLAEHVDEHSEHKINLLQFPVSIADVDVTMSDVITIVGTLVVVVRLVWDIYRESRPVSERKER